jgi:lipopolysaccharide/colanic/teichoic acid biosynthesis glycosyltransferase
MQLDKNEQRGPDARPERPADAGEGGRSWRQDAAHEAGPGEPPLSPHRYVRCKMAVEWVIALVLLTLAAPVVALCAALVRLTSRGPAFYSQVRMGRGGRHFRIHKLRTMVHNCERKTGARWAQKDDPRVTRVGRFLRRTHLDELPQLVNVLKGEMSLVGPRPERPEFLAELVRQVPHYSDRLLVRPGVTGLAQVQLPADTDLDSVRRKLAYDLYYVRHISLWLDARLMACTAVHVLGVPCHVLARMFYMPPREKVEHAYRTRRPLCPALLPELQPS